MKISSSRPDDGRPRIEVATGESVPRTRGPKPRVRPGNSVVISKEKDVVEPKARSKQKSFNNLESTHFDDLMANLSSALDNTTDSVMKRKLSPTEAISMVDKMFSEISIVANSIKIEDLDKPKVASVLYPYNNGNIDEYLEDLFESTVDIIEIIGEVLIEDKLQSRTIDERLIDLESFAVANLGVGVATFARRIFPELNVDNSISQAQDFSSELVGDESLYSAEAGAPDLEVFRSKAQSLPIPTEAPAIWSNDRLAEETPPAFVKRTYGGWLGKGLDRAHIRALDPVLSQALDNWLRKNPMPGDIDLPTRKERNDRLLASIENGDKPLSSLAEVSGRDAIREAQRLASAVQYRQRKGRAG